MTTAELNAMVLEMIELLPNFGNKRDFQIAYDDYRKEWTADACSSGDYGIAESGSDYHGEGPDMETAVVSLVENVKAGKMW